MNLESFQRARSPEAKEQRRQDILTAARAVLAESGIEATTLAAIAERAGIVKSNIYRYFESREEVLARLLSEDLESIVSGFDSMEPGATPEQIAQSMAARYAAHPEACQLIAQLAPILERNISTDTLRDIKMGLVAIAMTSVAKLLQLLPALDEEAGVQFMNAGFIMVAGLWPMSNPGPALAALYDEPQFEAFRHDFENDLAIMLATQLNGILAKPVR